MVLGVLDVCVFRFFMLCLRSEFMAVFIYLTCGVFQALVFCFIVVLNICIALFMLLSTDLIYSEAHILAS